MNKWLAALALLALNGCDSVTSTRDLADVADVNARNALSQIESLTARVSDLEAQNRDQKELLAKVRDLATAESKELDHLRSVVNFNADAANANSRLQRK